MNKGQFFSPDLLIAVLLFLVTLFFFFSASDSIFSSVNLFESKNDADEISNNFINTLIYSPGKPVDWETKELREIIFFGLVNEKNIIDQEKLEKLIYYLDNNYLFVKEKLGLGKNDLKLELVDFNGSILFESNKVFSNINYKLIKERIVLFNSRQSIFRGVVVNE